MHPLTVDGVAYPTEQDHPLARRIVITPRYFDIVDVKPVRGRTFERTDGPDAQPVAIVNERFVELFFKDRDPLGARSSWARTTCRGGRSSASCPTSTWAAPSVRSTRGTKASISRWRRT